jgi:Protein of unknown function (DUF2652)
VRALLVIADIGGYTRFMRLHRLSLAHAEENTSRLLEAIIDAAPRLQLSGLEGDAAFMFVREPEDEEVAPSIVAVAAAMHRSFHEEQQRIASLTLCPCDACNQIGRLTVKAVAHVGEAVEQTVRGRTSLAGPDVILVHRMLKNSVPIDEYLLVTEPVFALLGEDVRAGAAPLDEALEGLGTVRLHYVDVRTHVGEPPSPHPRTLPRRLSLTAGQVVRAVPYLLGLRRVSGSRP